MLLYYITDRMQFPGTEPQRRERLLSKISELAHAGVDFIQLREKDLPCRQWETLADEAVKAVRAASRHTSILINSRTDVALAVGADGVHLRSIDISATEVRSIWQAADATMEPIVSVSCHTNDDVMRAAEMKADFAVFGPVFEKSGTSVMGLEKLPSISNRKIPVLALGGVTLANATACMKAGAAGIAGIRLFQQSDAAEVISTLRATSR